MLESTFFRVLIGTALLLCAVTYRQTLSAQEVLLLIPTPVDAYRIGVRDRIQVDVWEHQELTNNVVVDSDGNIALPLIHEVKVSGLSATDVAILIRHRLERKIPNPYVTITVSAIGIRNPFTPLPQPPLRDLPRPQPPFRDVPAPDLPQDRCVARSINAQNGPVVSRTT